MRSRPIAQHEPHPGKRDDSAPLLRSHALVIARGAWILFTLISLVVYAATVPFAFVARQVVCASVAACGEGHLSPEAARALPSIGLTLSSYAAYVIMLDSVLVLCYVAVGVFIFWRKSNEPIALFVALALVLFGVTWPLVPPLLEHAPAVLRSLVFVWKPLGLAALVLLVYLFPDGRFVPRWVRWPALLSVGWQLIEALTASSGIDAAAWSDTWPAIVRVPLDLSAFCLPIFSQIYRYMRVSGAVERQQTRWVIFGLALTISGGALFLVVNLLFPSFHQSGRGSLVSDLVGRTVVGTFALLVIPIAIGIATLRYRLWDLDPIVNRTLVYGALSAGISAIYVLVVGYLGTAFPTGEHVFISLLATGLVAVLFQPLRGYLQRGINRVMYGQRDEPYAVLGRLGERLESTLAPSAMPAAIVETIAQALKLPYAALTLRQGHALTIAASYGAPVDDLLHVPLVYQGEVVGELLLAPRSPGEPFSAADRRLLDYIAYQAGIATQAVRLTADLQHSRERLVTAREEECRRLRRDLHDGLGPTLGGLRLKLDIAHDLILSDPPAAAAFVRKLEAETASAVEDIRNLAYQLRPPALDQFGIVGALRETIAGYSQGISGDLDITLDAPTELGTLPAAVEVAAYRIAQEALTNVVRHAAARSVTVRLVADHLPDTLDLEILDDGRGLPHIQHGGVSRMGVGLQSMFERADELGGACVVEARPQGGTRVHARLPCLLSAVPALPASTDSGDIRQSMGRA